MAGEGAEAGAVDEGLGVLDARADRERFGLDMNAVAMQHGEGVARAVADRQHHVVGVDVLAVGQHQAADMAAGVQVDVFDAGVEAVVAAEGLDFGADALDHGDQPERADVGFGGR